MATHRIATEYQECQAFWQRAQYHPIMRDYLIHIANEGSRSFAYFAALKSIGFRPGIPDYLLSYPAKKYHSLWFDMKRKGKKGSLNQDVWMTRLNACGSLALYVYSADEAYQLCIDYLSDKL